MKEFLDANVLLRYLTDDPPELGGPAQRLIESDREFVVSPHILAEVAYVLLRVYRRDREQVIQVLSELVQRENLSVMGIDREYVVEALAMCRPSNRISVGDAILWAEARTGFPARVWSFDRRFPASGIDLRVPK